MRQQLGAAQILQNDLLPILVQYPQDKVLFDAVIRYLGTGSWAGVALRGLLAGQGSLRAPPSPSQVDGEPDAAGAALFWEGASRCHLPAPFPPGAVLPAGLQGGEAARGRGCGWGRLCPRSFAHLGSLQAFASEKVFVVLSEKLYNLLQLVSALSPGGCRVCP